MCDQEINSNLKFYLGDNKSMIIKHKIGAQICLGTPKIKSGIKLRNFVAHVFGILSKLHSKPLNIKGLFGNSLFNWS